MMKSAFLVVAISAATAAFAADQPQAGADPNEVVCRTVSATGSRLAQSRRCATRAQWTEDERQQRAQLQERTLRQTNPTAMNPGARGAAFGRYVSPAARGGTPTGN
ncbi:MAG TPA: hypothetical protein VGW40_06570 [Allosphingosinicella sp.]|nr:hypothetical protein [Allosphingosinicella sp.]